MPTPAAARGTRWRAAATGAGGTGAAPSHPTRPRPCPTSALPRRGGSLAEGCRCRPARRRHAVDGAVPGDQGRQSRLHAVLPHGRFLRAVLRRRRRRRRGARHRAHQARQAPGRGHPHVRGADPSRGRVPAAPDPPGLPRRRVRAARGPGGSQEAGLKGGRAPRRRAPRHARHADRGQPARCESAQLSDCHFRRPETGCRRIRHDRARLARPLDRRVRGRRGAGGRLPRRDRAPLAWRGDRRRPPARRRALEVVDRHCRRRADAGARRVLRQPGGRAAPQGPARRRRPRRLRRLLQARACGRRRAPQVRGADAARQAALPAPAAQDRARQPPRHRCAEPREPRAAALARRRAAGQPARRHRPHGHRPRCARACRAARQPLARSRDNRAAARCRRRARGERDPARGCAGAAADRARHRPRDLAACPAARRAARSRRRARRTGSRPRLRPPAARCRRRHRPARRAGLDRRAPHRLLGCTASPARPRPGRCAAAPQARRRLRSRSLSHRSRRGAEACATTVAR